MSEEESKKLFRELWAWLESPEVKGAISSAWIHGYRISPQFSRNSGDMWDRVKKAAGIE